MKGNNMSLFDYFLIFAGFILFFLLIFRNPDAPWDDSWLVKKKKRKKK
jgi:hypothetical protein